ncbi:MAG: hypothetical protein R2769_15345 [Saprospiraceae bacterium]
MRATYGPLLGLFSFSIMMKSYTVRDKYVPVVEHHYHPSLPTSSNLYSPQLFYGFTFGFLIVALNGFLITFMGLWLVSVKGS